MASETFELATNRTNLHGSGVRLAARTSASPPSALSDLKQSRQSRVNAHLPSAPSGSLGSVQITHPFHPLSGKKFPVLKSRCVRGVECFVLMGSESGTFAIPQDWTDRARPNAYRDAGLAPGFFTLECLGSVVEILNSTSKKRG